MKSLRKTLGIQKRTEVVLRGRSPHATQAIIKLNHMSHAIQDKFSALLIQKGKLEHCIPMCAPSLITATNDGFTKGAN